MGTQVESVGGTSAPATGTAAPTAPLPGEVAPVISGDISTVVYLSGRNSQQQIASFGERQHRLQEDVAAQRKARIHKMHEQLKRQEDKALWDKVANVARWVGAVVCVVVAVVAVAAAVFSGGSTLVAAAALISAAIALAAASSKGTLWLDDMGVCDKKTAAWITLGLCVAAALFSGGGSLAGAAPAAASAAASVASCAAEITETSAQAVGSYAGYKSGDAAGDALEAGADSELAKTKAEAAQAERKEAIEAMKELARMQERIVKMAIETENTRQESATVAAGGRRHTRV
jgi:hypothetical protein